MHMHLSLPAGWFQRVMVIVLLTLLLLVCAEKEAASMVEGLSNHTKTNMVENQKHGKKQLGMKTFDLYLSRKRKVPNASDPLHNR